MTIELLSGGYKTTYINGNYRASNFDALIGGENRLLVVTVGSRYSDDPISSPVSALIGEIITVNPVSHVVNVDNPNAWSLVYVLYEEDLAQLSEGQVFSIQIPIDGTAGNNATMTYGLFSGVAQNQPEWSETLNLSAANSFLFEPETRSDKSLIIAPITFSSNSSGQRYQLKQFNDCEYIANDGWPASGGSVNVIYYRTDEIDFIEAKCGLPQDTTPISGWMASFASADGGGGGSGIESIGSDDQVNQNETDVIVTGYGLPTSGVVSLLSGFINVHQTVTSRSETGFTWSIVERGNLPYTDENHTHELVVENDPDDLTRSVVFDPPTGYVSYTVHPDYVNQNPGESVLSTVDTINIGSQIKVPTTIGGFDVVWEVVEGYATGAIVSVDGILPDDYSIEGVEFFNGTEWAPIEVTANIIESGENQPPVITLLGSTTINILEGGTYTEPGYTATDAEDGDLTDDVIVTGSVDTNTVGEYTLTYSVTDSGGLSDTKYRTINVQEDTENNPPVITLLGLSTVTINQGTPYTEPGYTATDAEDGDLTDQVTVSGTVNSNVPNTYTLTYSVTDSGGLSDTKQRTVIVQAVEPGDNTRIIEVLRNRDGQLLTNATNLTVVIRQTIAAENVLFVTHTATTDGNGVLTITSDSIGTVGSTVFMTLATQDLTKIGTYPVTIKA